MSRETELAEVEALEDILDELERFVAAGIGCESPPPAAAEPSNSADPLVQDVLSGLGYLVALQSAPEVGRAVPPELEKRILDSLVTVVRQWLTARQQPARVMDDFLQRTREHIRHLST